MKIKDRNRSWFNLSDLNKIVKMYRVDPLLAIKYMKSYLEEYPYDYVSYINYIGYLTELNFIDEAEKMIEYVDLMSIKNSNFKKHSNPEVIEKSDNILTNIKIQIYTHKKEYKKAYDLYKENWDYIKSSTKLPYSNMFYLENKLGIESDWLNTNEITYLMKQMSNYSYDLFIEHIKRHTYDEMANDKDSMQSEFYDDFPLEEALSEITKNISLINGKYTDLSTDTYVFKYNNCGRSVYRENDKINERYKNSNYIKVVALHGTNNLVTICPSCYYYSNYYTDLNYMKEDEPYIRTRSQIDRFNKRYNK